MTQYVKALEEVSQAEVQQCGGKAAGLGELTRLGLPVPGGFCVTGDALPYVVESNSLGEQISQIAADLDFEDYAGVEKKTETIRTLIVSAKIPTDLEEDIRDSFGKLVAGDNKHVAVRSSVAVRDSEVSSFPGMMDTYHYIQGADDVLGKILECWASLWTTRAAYARHSKEVPHEKGVIAPVVQLMIHSEVAGVLFTAHPITGSTSEIVIESNWGLGESVVSGKSMNDFFVLDKDTLSTKQKQIAPKTVMVTMDDSGSGRTERPVPANRSKEPTLSGAQLGELGNAGKRIEDHFGFNADVEWAFQDGKMYILQTRRIRGLEKAAQTN